MIHEIKEIKLDYSKIGAPDTGHHTTLECFIPNSDPEISAYTPHRPTVIILPGGAYVGTSEREADPIAMAFLAAGFNACILRYSCSPAVFPCSLLEALASVKYIRDNVERFLADPKKVYVCGFSAGGHLAASTGTLWDHDDVRRYFGDTAAVRPDGLILSYPVIINDDPAISHMGSFHYLLGEKENDKAMLELTCLDKRVTADTPPTFLWHTFEDDCVPCESSLRFAAALKKNGVPFELHIYEKGGHGGATGDYISCGGTYRLRSWIGEVCGWVNERSR